MDLVLYNTMTRSKAPFVPLYADNIRMYVCGPTVYDFAHVGNGRAVVAFDLLYRVLRHIYPSVTYARNITDIDDKIIKASSETGEPVSDLTRRITDQFHADMNALGALTPDEEPRATAYIAPMIDMTLVLIEKGHAYEADGHVLFHVPSMANYGRLSRRNRDEMIAGARVEVAAYKKNPADFVLWKPSREGEPAWDSPWGSGRPGWHLECSAMTGKLFGPVFDIHGGGLDLIFPHHENEIAQSCCAFGTDTMANWWVHNGYVTVEGEKMSKSLGNLITVHDMLDEAPGEAIRYLLLSAHYRQPLDFTRHGVYDAKKALDRFYTALAGASGVTAADVGVDEAVLAALLDDMNTPVAFAALHDLATRLNKTEDAAEKADLKGRLLASAHLLGFCDSDPRSWFQGAGLDDESVEIETMIEARNAARKAKDFARADAVRDELKSRGIVLEDGADGTGWKRA
ncbi:MAG: cysteine--tRNA ligase [Pseudomonadota bacterium]|nr:cysteine--tRNA ligase [Pseudomonadota bacterium]